MTEYLRSDADVEEAILLLRVAYLNRVPALRRRAGTDPAVGGVDVAGEVARLDRPAGLADLLAPGLSDRRGRRGAVGSSSE